MFCQLKKKVPNLSCSNELIGLRGIRLEEVKEIPKA
jgi:hypothetical protein